MTDTNKEQNSLIPIDSSALVKVSNSVEVTNKIIREHEERPVLTNYNTAKIGSQEWMIENLDVEFYSNGDPIPKVENPIEWGKLTTGAWCYYNNDPEFGKKYGKIYNWYAINDERGLAPKGFKVASMEDWNTLFEYLGETVAGFKLKSKNGWKENGNGSNEGRLNIHPAGYRMYNIFIGQGDYTHLWTSTAKSESSAFFVNFNYYGNNVFLTDTFKYTGSYLRCLKAQF